MTQNAGVIKHTTPPRPHLFEVATALGLAALGILQPSSLPLLLTTGFVVGAASLAGRPRLIFFCIGLCMLLLSSGSVGLLSVPIILTIVILGTLLHASGSTEITRRLLTLILITVLLASLYIASPPTNGTGMAAALALLSLPYGLVAAHLVVQNTPISSDVPVWLALGLATSVGYGLFESYTAILDPGSNYANVRTFESVIGSSNSAAAKATVVGILLLSLGTLRQHQVSRPFLILTALPFLAAPFLMASRGSLLGLLAGLAAIALTNPGMRRAVLPGRLFFALISSASIIALAWQQNWYVWRRIVQGFSSDDLSAGRTELYRISLNMIIEHPFTGAGLGGFNEALYEATGLAYSHNFVLDVLGQIGVIAGLFLLIAIIPRHIRSSPLTAAALITILLISLIEPVATSPTGAILYISVVAAHLAEATYSKEGSVERQHEPLN